LIHNLLLYKKHTKILSIIKEKTDLDFSASEFGFFEMLARRKRSVSDCVPDHIEMSQFETEVSFKKLREM